MNFIISTLIFVFAQLPAILLSFIVVPFMLLTKWDGRTTIFGNFKYGRGDTHYKAPSKMEYWKQLRFLCWRNPVSNFGKRQLAVKDAPWVWLEDKHVYKSFHFKYGWKDQTVDTPKRTFVYRPWLKRVTESVTDATKPE